MTFRRNRPLAVTYGRHYYGGPYGSVTVRTKTYWYVCIYLFSPTIWSYFLGSAVLDVLSRGVVVVVVDAHAATDSYHTHVRLRQLF